MAIILLISAPLPLRGIYQMIPLPAKSKFSWTVPLSMILFLIRTDLKGTVPPDFSPLFFFFKQLLLAPVGKPSDDLDFFRIFTEIFDFSGASPV